MSGLCKQTAQPLREDLRPFPPGTRYTNVYRAVRPSTLVGPRPAALEEEHKCQTERNPRRQSPCSGLLVRVLVALAVLATALAAPTPAVQHAIIPTEQAEVAPPLPATPDAVPCRHQPSGTDGCLADRLQTHDVVEIAPTMAETDAGRIVPAVARRGEIARRGPFDGDSQRNIAIGTAVVVIIGVVIGLLAALPAILTVIPWRRK